MPVKAKTIKDLPLKNEFDGSESLLVQDSNGTKQAPLEVIIDEIKQNSQEKIREIESELDQTNAQLSADKQELQNQLLSTTNNINIMSYSREINEYGANYFLSHDKESNFDYVDVLTNFKEVGGDVVTLCVAFLYDDVNSPNLTEDVTESEINAFCNTAKSIGLKVNMKIHTHRNFNNPKACNINSAYFVPNDVNTYFANYKSLLIKYGVIAVNNGCEWFALENEMWYLTKSEYFHYWQDIIQSFRNSLTLSKLKLTNSCTYQELVNEENSFLRLLDAIGFNHYPNYSDFYEDCANINEYDLIKLSEYDNSSAYTWMKKISDKYNIPFFITEVGCTSQLYCLESTGIGASSNPSIYDEISMAKYYNFFYTFYNNHSDVIKKVWIWCLNHNNTFSPYFNDRNYHVANKGKTVSVMRNHLLKSKKGFYQNISSLPSQIIGKKMYADDIKTFTYRDLQFNPQIIYDKQSQKSKCLCITNNNLERLKFNLICGEHIKEDEVYTLTIKCKIEENAVADDKLQIGLTINDGRSGIIGYQIANINRGVTTDGYTDFIVYLKNNSGRPGVNSTYKNGDKITVELLNIGSKNWFIDYIEINEVPKILRLHNNGYVVEWTVSSTGDLYKFPAKSEYSDFYF